MKYLALPLILLAGIVQAEVYLTPGFSGGHMNYQNGIIKYVSGTTAVNATLSNDQGYYGDFEFREDDDDGQGIVRNTLTFTFGKNFPDYGLTGFFGHQMSEVSSLGEKDFNEKDIYFENSGLFIGLAKNFSLSKTSNISTSVALGQMEAELEIEESGTLFSETTDALGASLGVAYTRWYTSGFAYSLGAKAQQYSYELENNDEFEPELVTMLYFKLSYRLNIL